MLLDVWEANANQDIYILIALPREDAGGLSREYVHRVPSVS